MSSLIGFAQGEAERQTLLQWFNNKDSMATAPNGKDIGALTLKQKHSVVRKVYSSLAIKMEVKQAVMAKLSEEKSDMLEQTIAFCKAALPEKASKRQVWDSLIGNQFDTVSLLEHDMLCAGFKQRGHLEIIKEFE